MSRKKYKYSADPQIEANVEAVLSDPEVLASLDEMDEQRRRGELVTYTHEEVLARLAKYGIRTPEDLGADEL